MREIEMATAQQYLEMECGTLHLSWAMDSYWGLITQNYILPTARLVYDQLVARAATEKHPFSVGDDDVFFIPKKKKKVFVHTTQSVDLLYVIQDKEGTDLGRFDVRRLYRRFSKRGGYSIKDLIGSLKKALRHADTLSEYSDDNSQFSRRPSLEAYRQVKFQIPYHPDDRDKEPDFYGDFRDGGYILSYDFFTGKQCPTVEGSKYVFNELDTLASHWLPSVARNLGLEPEPKDG